ncbi:MAG TPA: cytochrome P450 [Solirubrobacteraceae bacterium]
MSAAALSEMPRRVPLPAAAQTLWSLFDMDSFLEYCLKRYAHERMLTFRILGFGDIVSVFDPELVREVLTADSEVVLGGEATAEMLGKGLGPNSLLLLDGKRHLDTRRLLLPPFHGEAIRHHAAIVEQVTEQDVEHWPLDTPFALWPRMREITMEVILRTVIGVRDEERHQRLRETLPAFTRGGVFGMVTEERLGPLARGALGRRLPWVRARAEGERLLYEEIAEHRASPEDRHDVLALLTATRHEDGSQLSDQELRDHVLTLLVAGHDTTAASLAWCFERLLRHPEALARVREGARRQEADEADESYLTAVVNETMRLRPVIDTIVRRLRAPFELGGHRLPAGARVAALIAATQRSPRVYPDPLQFRPERFQEGQTAPYSFIPFGGGMRRCIGASFATMEIKTVLQTVLRCVDLRVADPRDERPARMRSLSIVPARGARAVATATLDG